MPAAVSEKRPELLACLVGMVLFVLLSFECSVSLTWRHKVLIFAAKRVSLGPCVVLCVIRVRLLGSCHAPSLHGPAR